MATTPIFHGTVGEWGTLDMPPAVRGLLRLHLLRMVGKPVEVTVRLAKKTRTNRQARYYFGVVVPLIAEQCGYDKQEMHELLAMRFLRVEDDPVTGAPRRKHTPDTDTREFAEYVDACIRFAAQELGVYIPSPNESEAA
jgi:hypothetical protein